MTAGGPTHEFDNDALLRMERTVRNHMDVCLHNISYELRLHEGLKREHVMLAKELVDRQIEPLKDHREH
jgi:hypothetical protein